MKLKFLFAFAISVGLIVTSCKKRDGIDSSVEQHNQDVNNTKSESDNLNTDINNALSNTSVMGKNNAVQTTSICGATIDSSHINDATPYIILTFDGTTTCDSRIRSGQVKVELTQGAHWHDAGAVLRVTHTNYKVVYTSLNNHYLIFNGVKFLTDVNGIDWISVWLGTDTIKVKERAYNQTVTFENGQTSTWSVARISQWWMSNSGFQINATAAADTVISGKNVDSWGTTRFNTSFITEMQQPWQSNTTCGLWRPTSGIYKSTTDNFTIQATLGTDASGNQISSGCAYGLKLDWTLGVHSGNAVIGYW
ncbi:MAG TPA: hypothetical protein VGB95_06405 [Chitinophagales bacterium]